MRMKVKTELARYTFPNRSIEQAKLETEQVVNGTLN